MSLPNLNVLKQISSLLQEVGNLDDKILDAQSDLAQLKSDQETHKQNLKKTLIQEVRQKKVLQSIQQEIDDLKQDENDLRLKLEKQIEQAVQSFLDEGGLKEYINDLAEALSQNEQSVEFLVGADTMKYVPSGYETKGTNPGQLRLKSGVKTYIFDILPLTEQLKERLLIEVLSSN